MGGNTVYNWNHLWTRAHKRSKAHKEVRFRFTVSSQFRTTPIQPFCRLKVSRIP